MIEITAKENFKLSYLGVSEDKVTVQLMSMVENYYSKKTDSSKLIKKRVPLLVLECFQNIIRHANIIDITGLSNPYDRNFFQVSIQANTVTITSANPVNKKDKVLLSNALNKINESSYEELRNIRRTVFEKGKMSSKGGAGLGMLEIAIKTDKPVRSLFQPINAEYEMFFFSFQLSSESRYSDVNEIQSIASEYQDLVKSKTILNYSGDFAAESSLAIIAMLDQNRHQYYSINGISEDQIMIIIEVVQNISKHGLEFEGINNGSISVSNDLDNVFVVGGNFINSALVNDLTYKIDHINSWSHKQLNEMYEEQLFRPSNLNGKNGGLGLMEIGKSISGKIGFDIQIVNEEISYFTIKLLLK